MQAHVYLRLPEGKKMDDIPPDTLEDACQLVKANSIQVWCIYGWALAAAIQTGRRRGPGGGGVPSAGREQQ